VRRLRSVRERVDADGDGAEDRVAAFARGTVGRASLLLLVLLVEDAP
jgi:hypothetical protein